MSSGFLSETPGADALKRQVRDMDSRFLERHPYLQLLKSVETAGVWKGIPIFNYSSQLRPLVL